MENSRRKFLKNIAYKAPIVVALGTLVVVPSANASNTVVEDKKTRKGNNDAFADRRGSSTNGGLE